MDANDNYYPQPPAPPTYLSAPTPPPAPIIPRKRRRAAIALTSAAFLLCTGGGAAIGLAVGNALHDNISAASATSPSAGGAITNPFRSGGSSANQTQGGYSGSYGSFSPFGQTQQSTTTETTSSASASQLVGLVRVQSTLGYENGAAVGSGLILSSNGEVVTNHHVIAGATSIEVTVMSTGQQYTATLVGSDPTDDVAVLQLQGASGLTTVQTDTSAASSGESVTAVGDAEGATSFTASPGKITATDQTISPSDGSTTETLHGIIQMAADVMSGDSGGATYNSDGQVIGMTTAASTGGTQVNGYAIPIAKVLKIAAALESHTSSDQYVYGLPAFIGVGVNSDDVVEEVYANTGAASAGIADGDQIVALNGTKVSTATQLQTATRKYSPGDTVSVTWVSPQGQTQTASVHLIQGPAV